MMLCLASEVRQSGSLVLIALVGSVLFGQAAAQDDAWFEAAEKHSYSCLPREDLREATWYGAPLDQQICIEMDHKRYRMAFGYTEAWGHNFLEEGCLEVQALGFSFMMPDRGYPHFNRLNHPERFVCDAEGLADTNRYRVRVLMEPPAETGRPYPYTPSSLKRDYEDRFGDALTLRELKSGLYWVNISGLNNRLWPEFFAESEKEEVWIGCVSLPTSLPNPACDGVYLDKESGILFFYYFPTNKLSEWKDIGRAVIVFLHDALSAQDGLVPPIVPLPQSKE